MTSKRLSPELRLKLLNEIKNNPSVKATYLAKKYNVSSETISHYKQKIKNGIECPVEAQQKALEYIKNNPGYSIQEVANMFGICEPVMVNVVKRSGIKVVSPAQYRNKQIANYVKENPECTAKEIAENFNITLKLTYVVLNKLGLKPQKGKKIPTPNAKTKKIIDYIVANPNVSYADIGRVFGTSRKYIYAVKNKYLKNCS